MANIIKLKVTNFREKEPAPYDMTIDNSKDICMFMVRDTTLIFNYRGDLYTAYDMKEKDFLRLCPHLDTSLNSKS